MDLLAGLPSWRALNQQPALLPDLVRPKTNQEYWRRALANQGEIKPRSAGLGERITNKVASGLNRAGMGEQRAQRLASKTTRFLDDLTPVGNAVMAADTGGELSKGHYLAALGGAALTFAPGIMAGPAKRAGKGMFGRLLKDQSGAIRAWHGSPHDFDKFSLGKIGTGEGNQAYGRGLYFAENKAVAQDYQTQLSGGVLKRADGSLIDPSSLEDRNQAIAAKFLAEHKDPAAAMRAMSDYYVGPHQQRQLGKALDDMLAQGVMPAGSGRLYEVNINAKPDELLDWDAPEWRQPEAVKRLLKDKAGYRSEQLQAPMPRINETKTGKFTALNVWGEPIGTFAEKAKAEAKSLAAHHRQHGGMLAYQKLGGNSIYSHLDTGEASRALREAGVPGLRYLDQGSRGAGDGTRNYVVFDDGLVDIINKF